MVVQDRRAADVLTNPHTLRQLEPFLGRDCTVSQAAEETGEKPNTVLSRVKRFLDLGLLKISGEKPRGGRAVKLYRSAADLFFIPYEATSAETLEAAMAERDAYWEALLRRGVVRARAQAVGAWGTRVYRDARGRLQVQAALNPESNYIDARARRPPRCSRAGATRFIWTLKTPRRSSGRCSGCSRPTCKKGGRSVTSCGWGWRRSRRSEPSGLYAGCR